MGRAFRAQRPAHTLTNRLPATPPCCDQGGDLRAVLSSECAPALQWYAGGKSVALDVLRGLAFIHSAGVVSRPPKTYPPLPAACCLCCAGSALAPVRSEGVRGVGGLTLLTPLALSTG